MTILRDRELGLSESRMTYNKDLFAKNDKGETTLTVQTDHSENLDQFTCFAKNSTPITHLTYEIDKTGRAVMFQNFIAKDTGSFVKRNALDFGRYLSPNELDEAFNNAELNDFITTLTPIYQAELSALYTALEGAKKTGAEIAEAVKT